MAAIFKDGTVSCLWHVKEMLLNVSMIDVCMT
jgi:hypothetical protein